MGATNPMVPLLDKVAPGLAAGVVARAFCRIPPPPPLAERTRVIRHGDDFEVLAGGRSIRGELWGGGHHVHLVHGWAGWHQQLGAHVTPLLEHGHQVLAHDALGHGESDPGPSGRGHGTVVDLADSLTAVAAAHGPVAGVVAHSAGAMATLHAIRHGLAVGRLALIAPSVSLVSTVEALRRRVGVSGPTADIIRARLLAMVPDDPEAYEFADLGQRLAEPPPLLVVHDTDDPESSIDDARRLVNHWPGAQLLETSGHGHRRVIWAPQTVEAVAQFFA